MKCDAGQLSYSHYGNSKRGEAGPMFPPLHVIDHGKVCVKAPPRNKMALFEQLVVPCSSFMSSQCASKRHDIPGLCTTCTQYPMVTNHTPAVVVDFGSGGSRKLRYDSRASLSTSSAVVEADESPQIQILEQEGETGSFESVPSATEQQDKGPDELRKLKNQSKDINMVWINDCYPFVGNKEQMYDLNASGFHRWSNKSSSADKLDAQRLVSNGEHLHQEIQEKKRGIGSEARSQLFILQNSDYREIHKSDLLDLSTSMASKQGNSYHPNAPENLVTLKESGFCSHSKKSSITIAPLFRGDMRTAPRTSMQVIIKPKDVINTVGQQLFWKARKAILRQQEIFANQVFELHKLIEVQRLLAKMPSTLIEDRLLSENASSGFVHDLYPSKVSFQKQESFFSKEAQQLAAPCNCETQTGESKPLGDLPTHQERDSVSASQQTKMRSLMSSLPNLSIEGPCYPAPSPSIFGGTSTWGYPLGLVNKPVLYPPSVPPFPPLPGVGAAYVLGSGPPPMIPLPFPCHAPRSEQVAPCFAHKNPVCNGSFFDPLPSNSLAKGFHLSPAPLASGSEKLGPANSVPSINTKAEASSQSVHFASVPCPSKQHQVKKISKTATPPGEVVESAATAISSTKQGFVSQNPGISSFVADGNRVSNSCRSTNYRSQVWEACTGKSNGLVEEKIKEVGQMPPSRRECPIDRDLSCDKNALDLFPQQPVNNSAYSGEKDFGRIIKAIPRSALAASESAARILRSIQRERQL